MVVVGHQGGGYFFLGENRRDADSGVQGDVHFVVMCIIEEQGPGKICCMRFKCLIFDRHVRLWQGSASASLLRRSDTGVQWRWNPAACMAPTVSVSVTWGCFQYRLEELSNEMCSLMFSGPFIPKPGVSKV
jgi:hypothetical protein